MAVSGIYCRKCNTLIPQQDVAAGKIVRVGRLIYCRKCSQAIEAAAEDSKVIDIRRLQEKEKAAAAEAPLAAPEEGARAEAVQEASAPEAAGPEAATAVASEDADLPPEGELPIVIIPPAQIGVKRHWVLIAIVLGVAAGGGVVWGVFGGGTPPPNRPGPEPTPPVVQGPGPAPTPLPPGHERVLGLLPLNQWVGQEKLKGVGLYLVEDPGPQEKLRPEQLKDDFPFVGKYQLLFRKSGYEDHRADIEVTEGGTAPSLATLLEAYVQKPTAQLQNAYRDGKDGFDQGRYEEATVSLRVAVGFDPEYRPSADAPAARQLLQDAESAIQRLKQAVEWEQRGQEALAEGRAAAVEEAARHIEQLLGAGHERAARLRRAWVDANRLAEKVAQAIEKGDTDEAQKQLNALKEIESRSLRIRDLQSQIDMLVQESVRIRLFLGDLSNAFDRNRPEAYDLLLAAGSDKLRDWLMQSTEAFVQNGGAFTTNQHRLRHIRFLDQGKRARVEVQRVFKYKVDGSPALVESPPEDLVYVLAKDEQGQWRLQEMGE